MFSEIIVPKNKNIELTPVCRRNFLYRKKKKKKPLKVAELNSHCQEQNCQKQKEHFSQ